MIIGITTAPRPFGINYLPETVNSLRAAGGENIVVFSEPGFDYGVVNEIDFNVVLWPRRLGNWGNWLLSAIKLIGLSKAIGVKYIATCEDDIQFSSKTSLAGAEAILDSLQHQYDGSTGPLLLYTSSVYQNRMKSPIEVIDSRSLCGSCAMLWPIEALKRVVECNRAKNWRGIGSKASGADVMHSDTCIGLCCNDLGLRVFAMKPSPVQHVGVVSSLHEGLVCLDMFASHFES